MQKEELLALLSQKQQELELMHRRAYDSEEWTRWYLEVQATVRHIFGEASVELEQCSAHCQWRAPQYMGTRVEIQNRKQADFDSMLERLKGWLAALILQVDRFGLPSSTHTPQSRTVPMVFIAHGSESNALTLLVDFLAALGCEPIIAEKRPSEGRSVDQNVEFWMDQSHCAVVLATGEELAGDQVVARPNVHIEIGRFQERFPGRIVYLLEDGTSFPSNIAEKVRERFSQDNMTKAFIKIANEFRAFGVIDADARD